VTDTFALPCEATETRVNAGADANEYMVAHLDDSEQVNRPENLVGWYHSHPGYGCWLSGIDVTTQSMLQKQGPWVAIVIDPKRTMSAGKVEIGCFRTYSDEYIKAHEGAANGSSSVSVPIEKIQELGSHFHKYHQLETSFYKSSVD